MGAPKPVRLLDAAGRPVVGFVERETKVADRWVGRTVRWLRPVHFVSTWPRLRRASIRFVGSTMWYEARYVLAPPRKGEAPSIPLLIALRRFSQEHWWLSRTGAIERRATLYEERVPDPPPRDGWVLVTSHHVADLIGLTKSRGEYIPDGETEREMTRKASARHHARALEHAVRTLARHEMELKTKLRTVDKWRARVARLRGAKT